MFSIVGVVVVGKAENQKTRLWSLLPEAPMLTEMHVRNEAHDSTVTWLRIYF